MHGRFQRQVVGFLIVAAVSSGLSLPDCRAQQQPVTLPAGWQQMSPTDFASAIRTLFDQGTYNSLSSADQQAATNQGKTLFLQINIASTTLTYQTLEMLQWVCRNALDQATIDQAKNALLARTDDWTGKPYAEIRAKVMLMRGLGIPEPIQISEARKWVIAGGTLAQVPSADLKFNIVRRMFADVQVVTGSFSVQWTGLLNAPQSGDYTFFISPINVNNGFKRFPVKLTMTVSIAGQNILTSTTGAANPSIPGYRDTISNQTDWTSQSMPVTLTAGTPVSLTVNLTVEAVKRLPSATVHAMLYWQGPGISKSIVPTANLTEPDAGKPGLKGKYTWMVQGNPQTLTRIDPNIDFAWADTSLLLSQDTSTADQTAAAMFQNMTSANYITATVGPPVQLHPFLKDSDGPASAMTTSNRETFLNLLLQNFTLLDVLDARLMVRFYESFRFGTPDKALDVVGAWAARQADFACEVSTDRAFNGDVRDSLALMAILTTQQFPDQALRLQNEFLQLPDGRCCLPVAYTLTLSYMGRGKAADWMAFLDGKLADPTLGGDLRVNWLIARAQAEEFGTSPQHYPYNYPIPGSLPLAGRRFLDQALQAAQSGPVKLRVAREIVGRLAWSRQFQAATDLLQQVGTSLPDDQKPALTALQQQFAGFVTAQSQALQSRAATANQAFLSTLKARQAQAARQGDTDAVNRYNALINAATNTP
jgi:hypothetical protein